MQLSNQKLGRKNNYLVEVVPCGRSLWLHQGFSNCGSQPPGRGGTSNSDGGRGVIVKRGKIEGQRLVFQSKNTVQSHRILSWVMRRVESPLVQCCESEDNQERPRDKCVKTKTERDDDKQDRTRNESGHLKNEAQISRVLQRSASTPFPLQNMGFQCDFVFAYFQ